MITHILETYSDAYLSFRSKFPNLYIICISTLVTIWFQGMSRIIDKLFPFKNIYKNMGLMIIPALLLYFGDGRLDEIYNFENLPSRLMAITRTSGDTNQDPRHRFKR